MANIPNKNNRKAILVTPEVCIGCRGCQTACKNWNQLPGQKTNNAGTYQNPPDLTPVAYNMIRFSELPSESNPARWLFVSRRCMHCDDAGCMKICPAPGALYRTNEGAVAFDKEKCIGCKLCVAGCPFNVPRYGADGKISKCHLCSDRIAEGLQPACTKTCPTGALKFGNRDTLIESAKQAGYGKIYGEADLGGLGSIFAFRDAPTIYGYAEKPNIPESVIFWHNVLKPLAVIGFGGAVAGALLHYAVIGPHKDEEVKKS